MMKYVCRDLKSETCLSTVASAKAESLDTEPMNQSPAGTVQGAALKPGPRGGYM